MFPASDTDITSDEHSKLWRTLPMFQKRVIIFLVFMCLILFLVILSYYTNSFNSSMYHTSHEYQTVQQYQQISHQNISTADLATYLGYNASFDKQETVRYQLLQQKFTQYGNKLEVYLIEGNKEEFNNTQCDLSSFQIVNRQNPDYMDILSHASACIKNVTFTDNTEALSDMLVQLYYNYVSNDCDYLTNLSAHGGFSVQGNSEIKCTDKIAHVVPAHKLDIAGVSYDLSPSLSTNASQVHLIYTHVVHDAVILSNGDVTTDSVYIIHHQCQSQNITPSYQTAYNKKIPHYKQVLRIPGASKDDPCGGPLQELLILAPYLPFLLHNPLVKIHMTHRQPLELLLGIDKTRLINGRIKTKLLFLPPAGSCEQLPLFGTQALSMILRNHTGVPESSPDTIILISSRYNLFVNHNAILSMLQDQAQQFGLTVHVYNDDPPTRQHVYKVDPLDRQHVYNDHPPPRRHVYKVDPLDRQHANADLFSKAVLIVTPSGVSGVNLLYLRPGAVLIEALCVTENMDDDLKSKLCYNNLSQVLGFHYYGWISNTGCRQVTPEDIMKPVRQYLTLFKAGLLGL